MDSGSRLSPFDRLRMHRDMLGRNDGRRRARRRGDVFCNCSHVSMLSSPRP